MFLEIIKLSKKILLSERERVSLSPYCSIYVEHISKMEPTARLAQSVEHETLNLRVVGSSPTLGEVNFYCLIYKISLIEPIL